MKKSNHLYHVINIPIVLFITFIVLILQDIPSDSIAVGIPAIIKKKKLIIINKDYFGN
jgi:serine acetyltransferase